MVNAGFDLWMNNSRGSRYSRDHMLIDLNYIPDKSKEQFFDHSFEQMADYDQPALWRYILEKTGASKITYIGHSQGTTQMFAALCGKDADFFRQHMVRFIAIAPVVYLENLGAVPIREAFSNQTVIDAMKAIGPE